MSAKKDNRKDENELELVKRIFRRTEKAILKLEEGRRDGMDQPLNDLHRLLADLMEQEGNLMIGNTDIVEPSVNQGPWADEHFRELAVIRSGITAIRAALALKQDHAPFL